jgi:dTDP-4-amino-4,6-dideoxygalactose transaminase
MNRPLPFLDLVSTHLELEDELVRVFRTAVRTAGFIGGSELEHFEREFATFCDVRHSVGVSSGTDALRFALMASGVQAGDTVVTVPNTFIATTEAISQAGGQVAFVDIDERTYTLDPGRLRAYLETDCARDPVTGRPRSRRTGSPVTAVVPVHLYGQMADMDRILDIAAQYNLLVIEDACQAHGAEYFSQKDREWHRAGAMGQAPAVSF